jgi:hypothetical protein
VNLVRLRFFLALLGLLLALVAVLVNDRRVTWVAIIVLSASFLLRLAARRTPPPDDSAP